MNSSLIDDIVVIVFMSEFKLTHQGFKFIHLIYILSTNLNPVEIYIVNYVVISKMFVKVTEKEKIMIIEGEFKYRKGNFLKKTNQQKWRCTNKNCTPHLLTDV